MYSLERRSKRTIQVLTDIILITACFALAMWLRLDSTNFAFVLDPWLTLIAVIPVTILSFVKLGLYKAVVRYISSKAFSSIAIGTLLSANVMFIVSQAFSLQIPRSVPFIYFIVLFLTVSGIRLIFKQIYFSQRHNTQKVVAIYGAGEAGRELLMMLEQSDQYKPVLFVDDNPRLSGMQIRGLTVLPFNEASKKIQNLKVKAILLAMPSVSVSAKKNLIKQLETFSIEVKSLPRISELIGEKTNLSKLRKVSIEELLGRNAVPALPKLMGKNIYNKVVLISGAGGSIGSELCRQVISQLPRKLILLDISEVSLYKIHQELELISYTQKYNLDLIPIITSVQDEVSIHKILISLNVQTIYHAAAYKHVPLLELNAVEGIKNNVFGTKILANAAIAAKVENFILISTDKAVRPSNLMGASKRLAELICQTLSKKKHHTCFSMVRFGNVLGSSGSVIPLFRKQISSGGPITVTHRAVERYFMTIAEAAELVIQAGSMAKGGDLFILDMGEPIKIIELAQTMARLHGLNPIIESTKHPIEQGDIEIKISGLRPGEKLYEELFLETIPIGTQHPRIMTAEEKGISSSKLEGILNQLLIATQSHDMDKILDTISDAAIDFKPQNHTADDIWGGSSENRTQNIKGHLKII